jgi:hypothetical protein
LNRRGYEPDELVITPQMIEAAVAVLRRQFGGETEGQNRFVDFRVAAEGVLRAGLAISAPKDFARRFRA